MIQRIQSIFLLLGAGSCFGLFGLPLARTEEAAAAGSLFTDQLFTAQDHWALLLVFGLSGLVMLLDIFLFRNRPLQMRLTLFALLLVVIGSGVSLFFLFTDPAAERAAIAVGTFLPLLAIVFALLAYRGIKSDEKLVRSADRLR